MKCIIHGAVFGDYLVVSPDEGAKLLKLLNTAKTVKHEYKTGTGYEYTLTPTSTEITFTLVSDSAIKYPDDITELVKLTREELGATAMETILDEGVNKE